MAKSIVGVGDARAVKRYGAALVHETSQSSFTMRNLTATDGSLPFHRLTDLESQKGDQLTVDIYHRLTGQGQYGDVNLIGTEEKLTSDTMTMLINQVEHGVNTGSVMSKKRTLWNHREIGMMKLREWWGRWYDEMGFIYAAGVRGSQTGDWLIPTSFDTTVGYSGNACHTPTTARTICPHSAATIGAIDSTDGFDMQELENVAHQLEMMANPPKPCIIDGEEVYILILHPYAAWTLRTGITNAAEWTQMKKYGQEGQSDIWKRSLGRFGNILMFQHSKIPVTLDGAGNVAVCRNLLMGRQAVAVAHGSASQAGKGQGQQFDWHEELQNRGRELVIDTFAIVGHKKIVLKFNENASAASEFGVITIPSYGGATVS